MTGQERAARLLSFVCDLIDRGVARDRVYQTLSPGDRECINGYCADAFAEMKKVEEEAVSEKWGDWWLLDEGTLTYADANLFIFLSEIKTAGDLSQARETVCGFLGANLGDFDKAIAELRPGVFERWERTYKLLS